MFSRCTRIALGLATVVAWSANVDAAPSKKSSAPEIFSIIPGEGPAGTVIKVTGTGFERTRYVLFSAGRTGQQAKFKVISDHQLEVTAPTYLRGGTSATLIVVGPSGATVGMPASVLEVDHRQRGIGNEATFYRVQYGGELQSVAQGIVLVEEGGVAAAPEKSVICFVKNGGTLQNADRFSGLAIHEPRAIFQTGPERYNPSIRWMRVPAITASLGVEPFIYYRPESANTIAESPPVVQSMAPHQVAIGGILALHGKGFSETSEVLFLAGESAKTVLSAYFQIVSDTHLDVEVPETLASDARMLVINPKGATLVIAQNDLRFLRRPSENRTTTKRTPANRTSRVRMSSDPVTLVAANAVVNDAGIRGVYFVEKGGRVIHTGGSCVYMVKSGGNVAGSGGRAFIVREPQANASIDAARRNSESDREVESVHLSVIPATFVVVPPDDRHHWRHHPITRRPSPPSLTRHKRRPHRSKVGSTWLTLVGDRALSSPIFDL